MRIWTFRRLAVQSHHLLPGGVRKTGENARFGYGAVALVLEYAAHRDTPVAKSAQQKSARFVVTHNAYRQDGHTEVREITDCVGGPARNHLAVAVFQDQHWGFARDPRNFTEHKLVGNQVAQNGDSHFGKRLHDLAQAVVFFDVLMSVLSHDGI